MPVYGYHFQSQNKMSCLIAPGSGVRDSPACVFSGAASVNA